MRLATSPQQPAEHKERRLIFTSDFQELSAEALLEHFQTRTTVHYFPVPDSVETARPKIDDILMNQFEFNGERHTFTSSPLWLTNLSSDQEWLILLHKFYYAVGLGMAYHDTNDPRYAQKWVDLTCSWIRTVPLDFLPSDVAGRRIQNWIFAHYYFVSTEQPESITPDFYVSFLHALHRQVSYLREHVTVARNHRTLELCAIFLAAVVFPEFSESGEWLTWSKAELLRNIQSDLLPDGVHCEQSTDYHHLVLKNYLWIKKLAVLNEIEMPEEFDQLVKKALEFSVYSHRPDGMIPTLSDGDSRCFLELLQQGYDLYGGEHLLYVATAGVQGKPPANRSKGFLNSGYCVLRSGWGDQNETYKDERYLIFDCGPLGAGNHGHLDLLSFEAYAYGTPLIMDPGRYTYDESGPLNWRVRFRETAAHNTVLVDGRNQTSYLPGKRRYKIQGPEPSFELNSFITADQLDYVHGTARSYEYPVVHERKILFVGRDYWVVLDLLRAQEPHHYDLLFHLSPNAHGQVSIALSSTTLSIDSPQLLLAQPISPTVIPSIQEGFISHTYGTKHAAPIVQLTQRDRATCFLTVVYPYKGTTPKLSIEIPGADDGLARLLQGTPTLIKISVTHGQHRYSDEIVIGNQSDQAIDAPGSAASSHVRVCRKSHDGSPIFQAQV
ncbi:MAG: alginate lyase family protein [Nitrospira sp.]